MKKWKIYFVPHTHWDKEWYFTKDHSNIFLVDNIDKLIEIVELDKENYPGIVFDGQLSIVDDYLAIYPDKFEKIKDLIKNKKLIIGPWYTQPDLFSTTGESIIRNLLIGKTRSSQLGATQQVGYLPDSFGFNSNLPQILSKANCPAIIQWRGVEQSHIDNSVLSIWKGEDDSEIILYNLYKYGYGLTFWAFNDVYKQWDKLPMQSLTQMYYDKFQQTHQDLNTWKTVNKHTNNILCFPFGSDQAPIVDNLEQFIMHLNKIDPDHQWILSTYDQFIEAIKQEADWNNIKTITGELKYGQFSRTHRTILSSRYDIKVLSKQTEYQLYYEAEPLSLIYAHFNGKYPQLILELANKKLLECHAHDSLGGSCTDQVNNEILNRLTSASSLLNSQTTLMKRRITQAIGLENNDLLVFNNLPYTRKVAKSFVIFTKSQNFNIYYNNEQLQYQLLEQTYRDYENFQEINSYLNGNTINRNVKQARGYYRSTVLLNIDNMPGLSYRVLKIKEIDEPLLIEKTNDCIIENEYYKVIYDEKNGWFDLLDKLKQQLIKKAISLSADIDLGDTYDYSPSCLNQSMINNFVKAKVNNIVINNEKINHLFLIQTYKINQQDEQIINWNVYLNNDLIDIKLNLINQFAAIRWRVIFDTQIESNYSYADQSLALIKRAVVQQDLLDRWEKEKWKDMPVAIESCESFVYLKNLQDDKFVIFTKGNNEYEIIGQQFDKIALTLFRSVKYLGNRNLVYRPGRASGIDSYPYPTPQSELKKQLQFHFAIKLTCEKEIAQMAKNWITPNSYYQMQKLDEYFNPGQTFWMSHKPLSSMEKEFSLLNLDLSNKPQLTVSAIKKSIDNDYLIYRIANISTNTIQYNLNFNEIEVDLLEQNEIKTSKRQVVFKKNEIKTFKLKLK